MAVNTLPPGYANAKPSATKNAKTMQIYIPASISNCEPELRRYVEAMVYKLRKNSHKGKWEDVTIERLFSLMMDEMKELQTAIEEGTSIEIVLEAADIGNFAMMIAAVAIEGRINAEQS